MRSADPPPAVGRMSTPVLVRCPRCLSTVEDGQAPRIYARGAEIPRMVELNTSQVANQLQFTAIMISLFPVSTGREGPIEFV